MRKFKIGDRVVDFAENSATVVEVRKDRIRLRWDGVSEEGHHFWSEKEFDLIENNANGESK